MCEIMTDTVWTFESVSGPDEVTNDSVALGDVVYMDDDHTVTASDTIESGEAQIAGIFLGMDNERVKVWIRPDLRLPPPPPPPSGGT